MKIWEKRLVWDRMHKIQVPILGRALFPKEDPHTSQTGANPLSRVWYVRILCSSDILLGRRALEKRKTNQRPALLLDLQRSLLLGTSCFWFLLTARWFICLLRSEIKSLDRVRLFATPWTIQSMAFSRPEYWSGLPVPSPGNLPDPGMKLGVSCIQKNHVPWISSLLYRTTAMWLHKIA